MTIQEPIEAGPAPLPDSGVPQPPPGVAPRWGSARRVLLAFLIAGTAIAAVALVERRGSGALAYVSTDNAYVEGDVTFISPKVPGYVTAVLTEDDRLVKRDQV